MKDFQKLVQAQFDLMQATGKLYRVDRSGRDIWEMYLAAFPDGQDPQFRDPESSEHNCNHCKNFIRRYGNIVAIDPETNQTMTMFDVVDDEEYNQVAIMLAMHVGQSPIVDVFVETFVELNALPYEKCTSSSKTFALGMLNNVKRYNKAEADLYPGVVKEDEIRTFNHIQVRIDSSFIDKTGKSSADVMGDHRDNYSVFSRTMNEVPLATLEMVRDLINQGSLLNAESHKYKVEAMIGHKKIYDSIAADERVNWCWLNSKDNKLAKFKNELIGTLCTELALGEDLNKACLNWNKRADKANYMKAVAPFTESQRKQAVTAIDEGGYTESFDRRFAQVRDIRAAEIKHMNSGETLPAKGSILDGLAPTKKHQHVRNEFDGIPEVGIEQFMKDVLPSCTGVQLYLDNKHESNMVSMTTAKTEDSKPMFNWPNNYSWTYNGNLAGKSELKEQVAARGGNVDGDFRWSFSWNHDGQNQSLMDLHVFMPGHTISKHGPYGGGNNRRVGWNHRQDGPSGGVQDVDNVANPGKNVPVENITFPNRNKMPEGEYVFTVHNYQRRLPCTSGFKAEIEFDGDIYEYDYPQPLGQWEVVVVAVVTLKDGVFTIDHKIPCTNSSKEIYGLDTKKFHKVDLVCLSPNHWGDTQVGDKHYFFMLDGCKAPAPIRSYHAENLVQELAAHRKVLEPFGSTIMLESNEDPQLSGVGFGLGVTNEVIVKLEGNFKRTMKIKF